MDEAPRKYTPTDLAHALQRLDECQTERAAAAAAATDARRRVEAADLAEMEQADHVQHVVAHLDVDAILEAAE